VRIQINARRSIALLCLAVLFLAALIPSPSSLPFFIPAPLWLFIAAIVMQSIGPAAVDGYAPSTPFLAVISERAPPLA
jgi:hypothetical protein